MRSSDWSADVCSADLKRRAEENNQLYVMNRDGSGKRSLTADWDYGVDAIEWAADGRSVYAQYDDHGETKVARIGLDGGVRTAATGLSGGGLEDRKSTRLNSSK